MGLGFPDQTIIWDGSAVENTTNALLEEQALPSLGARWIFPVVLTAAWPVMDRR